MSPELETARDLLLAEEYTCVVVSAGQTVTFREGGVRTLMRLLAESPELLRDACVADKVVGKAAALLLVLGGVREVYGAMLSETAAEYLSARGIPFSCGKRVTAILNRRGDGLCPMEQLTLAEEDPQAGYDAIARFIAVRSAVQADNR